jgi:hypothetical protein
MGYVEAVKPDKPAPSEMDPRKWLLAAEAQTSLFTAATFRGG